MSGLPASPKEAVVNGEVNVGKGLVTLGRVDAEMKAGGGFPIAPARVYNNSTMDQFSAGNADGDTMLGPRWAFNYDARLIWETDDQQTPTGNILLRWTDGSQLILYQQESNIWKGNPAQGAPVTLTNTAAGLKLTIPDSQVWYEFRNDGRLTRLRAHGGNTVDLTYDSNGLMTRADFGHETNDTDDRFLAFDYTSVTYADPSDTTVTKTRLWKIRDGLSNDVLIEYQYDDFGMLWRVKNRFGQVAEEFINRDRTIEPGVGLVHEIRVRDENGNMRSLRSYEYSDDYRYIRRVRDGAGSELFHVDQDIVGHQATVSHANGTTQSFTYDYSRSIRTAAISGANFTGFQQMVHDSSWGHDTIMPKAVGNDDGTTTTYYYLSESPSGAPGDRIHASRVVHPDGTQTSFAYNGDYHVTSTTLPGGRVHQAAFDAAGNRVSATDPLGRTTFYQYDDHGRVTRIEDPTSGTTLFAYNTRGQVTVTTDTEGHATTYTYDSTRWWLTRSVTSLGITTSYDYDSRDRQTTVTNALAKKTVYGYDGLDRRISVTNPLGQTTRYVYNTTGSLQNVIDAADHWTTYTYDFDGHLARFTDQNGHSTEYTYDSLGRLVAEKNPLNQVTRMGYVAAGGGCGSCGSSTYGAGKVAWVTDPANRTTSRTYDIMGRLKSLTYSGASDRVDFDYDTAGRRIAMTDTRLTTDVAGGQVFRWGYDMNDRLTTETYPDGSVVSWAFDALARRTRMTDPDGRATQYNYANTATNKRLATISHPLSQQSGFYYDTHGRLLSEAYTNYTSNFWHYDPLGRVDEIHHRYEQDDVLRLESYTYNDASMRTRIDYSGSVINPSYHKLYRYDATGQLTEEHKRWSANNASAYRYAYTYDPAGNRTQLVHYDGASTSTISSVYDAGNQLYYDSNHAYVFYDVNGNLSELWSNNQDLEREALYEHNRENRLISAQPLDGGPVTYTYDALGRRIVRTAPDGSRIRYYCDGLNILMTREKPAGTSTWRTKQAYTLKQVPIGQIIAEHTATAWNRGGGATAWSHRWYHFDLLGNTTLMTDSTGAVTNNVDMEAFGTVLSGGQNGFRLTTKQYDQVTGIYGLPARDYSGNTGSWIEREPLRLDGPNLYRYCHNNPVSACDYDGLLTEWLFGPKWGKRVDTVTQIVCTAVLSAVAPPAGVAAGVAQFGLAVAPVVMYPSPEAVRDNAGNIATGALGLGGACTGAKAGQSCP